MKIEVLKNTPIDVSKEFNEAKSFFANHSIDLEFTFKDVSLPVRIAPYKSVNGFSPLTGKPSVVKYYGLQDKPQLNNTLDGTILVWDLDTVKQPTDGSITSWTTDYIQIALNKYLKDKGEVTNRITHEIMHYLCVLANKKGFKTIDEMDVTTTGLQFAENNNPLSLTGNYARTFKNLQPFIKSLQITPVVINRRSDTGIETLGDLTYGSFTCKTLERPWKENRPNISCIPKGIYQCKYNFSPKFMKYTYQIMNVPKRSGIRIHSGNYFFDIEGCILLGSGYENLNNDRQVDIINSKVTIKAFEQLMGKKDFTLIIK